MIQEGRSRGRYRKVKVVWICNQTSLQKHTKKKTKKWWKRREEERQGCLSPHYRPGATEKETSDECLTRSGRTGQPEAVLLPRLGPCPRMRWNHIELHVLDMPLTWEADQVVGLSPCDLPVTLKDKSQSWVFNEGRSQVRPPPGSAARTSHPRHHSAHLPLLPLAPEASPK